MVEVDWVPRAAPSAGSLGFQTPARAGLRPHAGPPAPMETCRSRHRRLQARKAGRAAAHHRYRRGREGASRRGRRRSPDPLPRQRRRSGALADLYADALLVPFVPKHEDYGLITIEAFKSGKPVLTCTDSGETLEFVRDGHNGYVVEPNAKGHRAPNHARHRPPPSRCAHGLAGARVGCPHRLGADRRGTDRRPAAPRHRTARSERARQGRSASM